MINKILRGVSTISFIAFIVLLIYWIVGFQSSNVISPSGWWWFSCLLIGAFTAEIQE